MPRRLSDATTVLHKASGRKRLKRPTGEMAERHTSPNGNGAPPSNPPAGSTAPAATDNRPALNEAQHILEMARELKKLAARSGLARVALILEMAELEARDQVLGRA